MSNVIQHAAGVARRETGARVVLTAARSWFGQQVGVRVLGLRALGAGEGRTDSEHPVLRSEE